MHRRIQKPDIANSRRATGLGYDLSMDLKGIFK